jgi:hypothetical protein
MNDQTKGTGASVPFVSFWLRVRTRKRYLTSVLAQVGAMPLNDLEKRRRIDGLASDDAITVLAYIQRHSRQ